jgi:hypothetical protein
VRWSVLGAMAGLLSALFAQTVFAQGERQFANGTVWVPLHTKLESYMVLERGSPRCSGGRRLMISFPDRETVSDQNAVRSAILDAVERLVEICKEAKSIGVDGYVASEAQPNANGEISYNQIVLRADVGRWSGPIKIASIDNKVLAEKIKKENAEKEAAAEEAAAAAAAAAEAELEAKLAQQKEEAEKKRQEDEARLKTQQAEIANHIAEVRALAQPQSGGLLTLFGNSAEQKLIGVWSNADGLCDKDLLVFYVQDNKRLSEFWSSAGRLRLAPVFQGEWTVDNDILQLNYTKQLKTDGLSEAVEVKEAPVGGRVRLISADQDSLTITAKGVSDPHPLFLFYPDESKLLRCK